MINKSDLHLKIEELGRANNEIKSITLINDQGLLLAQYTFQDQKFDEGEQTRLGAMILACQALATKTLASVGFDKSKFFTVKAQNANVGIAFSDKLNLLVVSEKKTDIKSVTKAMFETVNQIVE